jgi:putative transcriptional regulator
LSGSILLSHPSLKDPNFSKSVVFLSAHSEESGTIGVILNRPLGHTLEELDDQFKGNKYGEIPVFEGGPVDKDKIIVAAWEWMDDQSSFKLYFGIDLDNVDSLLNKKKEVRVVCFLGHSGWSPGQLENELDDTAWLVSSLNHELFTDIGNQKDAWRKIVGGMSEELRLLAEAPENPSLN